MLKTNHIALVAAVIFLAVLIASAFLFVSKVSNLASNLIKLSGEPDEKTCDSICKDQGYNYGTCKPKLLPGIIEETPPVLGKPSPGIKPSSPPTTSVDEAPKKESNNNPPGSSSDASGSGAISDSIGKTVKEVIGATEVEIGTEGCFNGEVCNCGFTLGEKKEESTETSAPAASSSGGGKTCTSSYQCSEWSECIISYDIESIVQNEFTAISWKERLCTDSNACSPNRIEREVCDKTKIISFRSEDMCAVKHTVVIDKETGNEVARLRPVFGGSPRFDIDIGEQLAAADDKTFCWYCSDGVQDYDEQGQDCGGPSCPACGFEVQLAKKYPAFLYTSLIVILSLMIAVLLWLEFKNFKERDYRSLIFYGFRKTRL